MKKHLLFSFVILLLAGFFTFFSYEQKKPLMQTKNDRSFVIVVPFHNQSKNISRILDSIVSQSYKKYRIVLVNDGSTDNSREVVQEYLQKKARLLRPTKVIDHKEKGGSIKRMYESSFSCSDQEMMVLLDDHRSFKNNLSLATINEICKEKDSWLILAGTSHVKPYFFPKKTSYTSYLFENGLMAFQVKLFRQIPIEHFFHEGHFLQKGQESAFLHPMIKLAKSHYFHFGENIIATNEKKSFSAHKKNRHLPSNIKQISLRKNFSPQPASYLKADLVIFSFDRPLQLYSLLESAHKRLDNVNDLTVIYRTSSARFALAYEELKNHFPDVNFLQQSSIPEKDFKPLLEESLFDPQKESPYVIFAVDDLVFTDKVDLAKCIELMEKTKGYFFSLRLGKNIDYCYMGEKEQKIPESAILPENVIAWQISSAEGDWAFFHSLDATLYRKKDLKKIFPRIQYKNPNTLEGWWNKTKKDPASLKKFRIGLCFNKSKTVNVPINVVNGSDNQNMNLFTPEELLEKFEKRKKMDLEVFEKVDQNKVHMEIEPKFISRKKKENFLFHEPEEAIK